MATVDTDSGNNSGDRAPGILIQVTFKTAGNTSK